MLFRRTTHRRRPLLTALIAVLGTLVGIATVIAVVASTFIGGLAKSFDTADTLTDAIPIDNRPAPAPSVGASNILLIGSDSRAELDRDHDGAGGRRADTLMLVHIPADRKAAYLMSIMRDSWVPIPGHGEAKINAAYNWGGAKLTVRTVEQLLNLRIDHVAEIDFAGFEDMTDALGGVTVAAPKDFTARGHHFAAGPNRLDGDAALAFVRERYAFADADYTRVQNQQAFMRGILEGLLSKGTMTNPTRIQDFVSATSEHLAVDPGLNFSTLVGLGWSLRGMQSKDLHTFTMPTAGGGTSVDGQSYISVDAGALTTLQHDLRTDHLDSWQGHHPQ